MIDLTLPPPPELSRWWILAETAAGRARPTLSRFARDYRARVIEELPPNWTVLEGPVAVVSTFHLRPGQGMGLPTLLEALTGVLFRSPTQVVTFHADRYPILSMGSRPYVQVKVYSASAHGTLLDPPPGAAQCRTF